MSYVTQGRHGLHGTLVHPCFLSGGDRTLVLSLMQQFLQVFADDGGTLEKDDNGVWASLLLFNPRVRQKSVYIHIKLLIYPCSGCPGELICGISVPCNCFIQLITKNFMDSDSGPGLCRLIVLCFS